LLVADPQNTTEDAYSGPYRWNVTNGPTPSLGTGPAGPHTGSKYAYTEASGSYANDITYLYSPALNMSNLTSPLLSFYYFMRGDTMGTLSVDTYDGTTWTNDIWTISGQQQISTTDDWINLKLL